MAKFYQRYFPAPATNLVQYGYRGSNYTVNGQQYDASTNLELTGNYQINCANNDCSSFVGNYAVDSLFEPMMIANNYDLGGSRFSGDYAGGQFWSHNTYRSTGTGTWTFKNHGQNNQVYYSVQTSTANLCLTGCVIGTAGFGTYSQTCQCFCNSTCSPCYNFIVVEAPTGTYNCFVPMTTMSTSAGVCSYCSSFCACFAPTQTVPEPTCGDTCVNYSTGSCWQVYYGGTAWCIQQGCENCIQPYARNTACIGDASYFGNPRALIPCAAGNYPCMLKGSYYSGTHPLYAGTGGTAEYGLRTFVARGGNKTWYFHYNSDRAGIQGSDTTGVTLNKLTLRVYDATATTTTVVTSYKKGISGLVIPSNPDVDDGSTYRFYFMQFNGFDTATQTITIYRISINLSTGAVTNTTYTNSMSAGDQQAVYANLGHNNTAASKLDNPAFRRQTVNRIWYSVDSNSVKRLHMGVYNTNGTELITGALGFSNDASAGSMYKIYSWTLDDGATTATYIGSAGFATYAPTYFCPLTNSWTVLYAGSAWGNDVILTLNATTGLYQYANTMPYKAARLFKDKDGRWASHQIDIASGTINGLYNNYFDIITADVGATLVLTANTTSYVYSGNTISGNVSVDVYNYLGNRVSKTVALSVVGATTTPGITFTSGGYTTSVVTSASASTVVGINVISSASAKIVGTVQES